MNDTASMTAEEIIEKVESGKLSSCEYGSITEYIKAMEE